MKANNLNNKKIILFDGVCNMCVWSVQFIIKNDKKDIFRFASLQSKEAEKYIKNHRLSMNSIMLIDNGKMKSKSSAVLSILSHLDTFWRILLVFYIIPYPIRDLIYISFAKSRYFFFGKRNNCMVPNKEINSKFLSLS